MSKAKKPRLAERCRCCLRAGDLENMWRESVDVDDGISETYGELLAECFAISLQPTEHLELICSECVRQLRSACQFKKLVLASDEFLSNEVTEDGENLSDEENTMRSASVEEDDPGVEYLDLEFLEEDKNAEVKEELLVIRKRPYGKKILELKAKKRMKYTKEDLRSAMDAVKVKQMSRSGAARHYNIPYKTLSAKLRAEIAKESTVKINRPELKPNKCTKEDIRKAMEAVNNDLMSIPEAARYYNIPYMTLSAKLGDEVVDEECPESPTEEDKPETNNGKKNLKLIEEIQIILTYTNATPFKTKASKHYCAYCSTDGPSFEPDDLRAHVRTRHINDRVKGVDVFMRPYNLNEVLKIDIDSLLCSVCCVTLDGWNEMFEHLAEKHEEAIDQATDKVIPFKLAEKFNCALCNENFSTFSRLDGHMNAHYSNYICGECGVTFLSESRLRSHEDSHRVGRFVCQFCSKVFTLEKYRRKHIDMMHVSRNLQELFKCRHCPRKFKLEQDRNLHETTAPRCAEMKNNTCTICGKVFSCRQYCLSHLRLQHMEMEDKHECKRCGKRFKLQYELTTHERWHTGKYVCNICERKYSSKQSLMTHMNNKHDGNIVSTFT